MSSSDKKSKESVGYIDGFVIPVPKKNIERYRELATLASEVWRDHGALDYLETIGEDMDSEFGIPFPKLANTNEDEIVVFAYISYRDRAHRDEVNRKVMADERMKNVCSQQNSDFEQPMAVFRFWSVRDKRSRFPV